MVMQLQAELEALTGGMAAQQPQAAAGGGGKAQQPQAAASRETVADGIMAAHTPMTSYGQRLADRSAPDMEGR